eukprot:gene7820-10622_t
MDNSSSVKQDKLRILLGCTGSVACVKIPILYLSLSQQFDVRIVCTEKAKYFIDKAISYNEDAYKQFVLRGGLKHIFLDDDEWQWSSKGDSVLHIELRRWANILLVAPATANSISKAACGISDNLLLSLMRAWDFKKPCLICPAMNTYMWDHPSTATSLKMMKMWGWHIIDPISTILACNDIGMGAMASIDMICSEVYKVSPNIVLTNESVLTKLFDTLIEKRLKRNKKRILSKSLSNGIWIGSGITASIFIGFFALLLIFYDGNDTYDCLHVLKDSEKTTS